MIVLHHLGYRGFHSRAALAPVLGGCGLLSLAYLVTVSPLAAVGGHIILHTALTLRGTDAIPFPLEQHGPSPRRCQQSMSAQPTACRASRRRQFPRV